MAEKHIDLGIIRENIANICVDKKLIAVIKADAYGHGALRVAQEIEDSVCAFAVADVSEAEKLAFGGIKKEILILSPTPIRPYRANIIRTFSDIEDLNSLGNGEKVAVKIDTGMHRYGVEPNKAEKLLEKLSELNALRFVFTHLRCPTDKQITAKQLGLFDKLTMRFDCLKHVYASRALKIPGNGCSDTVRCGIAVYGGIHPFKQAMSIFGRVQCTRIVPQGEGTGYGNDILSQKTHIAVTDIGYADGYRRSDVPRYVYLGGKRRKVLAVCMDCTIVEADEFVKIGDAVEFLGKNISADELSSAWGTDSYELFTTFGRTFKTIYD